MNNPEIDKKLSGAIDEVISIYLESTDVEVIDLFRSLTRHVISLNYQCIIIALRQPCAQCLNDVMCDLQEQKIFNDEFKDNLKKSKVTSVLEDHLKRSTKILKKIKRKSFPYPSQESFDDALNIIAEIRAENYFWTKRIWYVEQKIKKIC